jgi:outer membrane receptor for ferrienterochelin and colicins
MKRAVQNLALLTALTLTSRAHAEGADLQSLLSENVITTASKSAETSSTAPATSTILTAEDIRTYGIHSIDEAIDFLSLGVVTSNTLRAADVGARGVLLPRDQGNHFLMLVDGHAVNEPLYGTARVERGAGIPMEMVDHIEVILGPGSVLYGSNAMLGVINVVTKRASALDGTHLVVESEILKSWRVGASAGYQPMILGTKSELAVGVEYYRQDGPTFDFPLLDLGDDWSTGKPRRFSRTGEPTGLWGGKAAHSYYAAVPSALVNFRFKNLEISLHGSTYKRAAPYNSTLVGSGTDFDDPDNYELDRSAFIDIKDQERLSQTLQVTARVYGDTFDYQRYMKISSNLGCLYAGVFTCQNRTIGVSRRAGAELQTSWDWLKDGSFVSLLGADGQARSVSSSADVFDFDTGRAATSTLGYLREHDQILGLYMQQTWSPSHWLAANAGGRLDFDERFGRHFSPRAALSTQPWTGGTLKAIYSEAFRAPSWQESAWVARQHLPTQDLRPEQVRSVEAIFEQRLLGHQLSFGVFRSWWKDLVDEHTLTRSEITDAQLRGELGVTDGNTATQYRNVSSIDNYGFNAGYSGTVGTRFRYGANLTGAIARSKEPGAASTPLVVAPQFFGNIRGAYTFGDDKPTVALAAHYLAARPTDRAFDGNVDRPPYAPAQLELRGTLTGPLAFIPGFSYRLSANYAFASRGAYIVGPLPTASVSGNYVKLPPEYLPVDQFRATVGIQYDFGKSQ